MDPGRDMDLDFKAFKPGANSLSVVGRIGTHSCNAAGSPIPLKKPATECCCVNALLCMTVTPEYSADCTDT